MNFYPLPQNQPSQGGLGPPGGFTGSSSAGFFLASHNQAKRKARREILLLDAQREMALQEQMMMRMFKDSYLRKNQIGE